MAGFLMPRVAEIVPVWGVDVMKLLLFQGNDALTCYDACQYIKTPPL